MAQFSKQRQREAFSGGIAVAVQALTQASTATRVTNHGITTITSAGSGTAGDHGFILQAPFTGITKAIVVDPNSTRTVSVYNQSTGITFFGSTANALTFSTGSGHRKVTLVGLSATSWAITAQSTGVTLVASTVSA